MRIVDFLTRESIMLDLAASTKIEVIEELCAVMSREVPEVETSAMVESLAQREQLGSTGIGDGVAIPHGKVKELPRLVGALGISKAGIDFDAVDGAPVHVFFGLTVPESTPEVHVKALSRISRLLQRPELRRSLLEARSAKELHERLIREDEAE